MMAACGVASTSIRWSLLTARHVKRGVILKVRELIDLNQMIVDAEITVRQGGSGLLDQLNIGSCRGKKPPFPTMIPISEQYIGNSSMTKEAKYIDKSINAWDDGHDYWQVKTNRIPEKWLDLEVYSWEVWPASTFGNPRRRTGAASNVNFHGQRINIIALPSGEKLEIREPKRQQAQDLDGQMTIDDWESEVNEE